MGHRVGGEGVHTEPEACQKAFNCLREVLTQAPVLLSPDPDRLFLLDTDASNEGIVTVLSQRRPDEERVVTYFSRSLRKQSADTV